MCLFMTLSRVKRIDASTASQINAVNEYFSFKARPEELSNCYMKEYCGLGYNMVNKRVARLYEEYYNPKHYLWDSSGKYEFKSVFQEVMYWNRANHIHKWFVDNVQGGIDDCGSYEVGKNQVKALVSACEDVLNHRNNSVYAMKNLPTYDGRYFGSLEYDENYYHAVASTKESLEKILKETDFDNEMLIYDSIW